MSDSHEQAFECDEFHDLPDLVDCDEKMSAPTANGGLDRIIGPSPYDMKNCVAVCPDCGAKEYAC